MFCFPAGCDFVDLRCRPHVGSISLRSGVLCVLARVAVERRGDCSESRVLCALDRLERREGGEQCGGEKEEEGY